MLVLTVLLTCRISCLGSCLSDRLIELAELAEEIVDTVLSCLVRPCFLFVMLNIFYFFILV